MTNCSLTSASSWDRGSAQRDVDSSSVRAAVASFDRAMAGHVLAAAVLEGNPFTYPEVQTLLEGITVGGRKVSDADQILRLRDAFVLLRDLVTDEQFVLNKPTSDAILAVLARNEAPESGHFRGEGDEVANVSVNLGARDSYARAHTAGGADLREIFDRGLTALDRSTIPSSGPVPFPFRRRQPVLFDGNKRTGRSMMNGVLMSAGIEAVVIPAQSREEFNSLMTQFHAERDATAMLGFLASCGPRQAETSQRWDAINAQVRSSPDA